MDGGRLREYNTAIRFARKGSVNSMSLTVSKRTAGISPSITLGIDSRVKEMKALGLDVPPMVEMAACLRDGGFALSDDILTVDDMVKELKQTLCPSGLSR